MVITFDFTLQDFHKIHIILQAMNPLQINVIVDSAVVKNEAENE
jgi:hypothetical protein